ncbi:Sigma-70, region 4 [Anatilimnocola aggregata]|uniref:Sigma-70, region 4 n=1 Tax=Anatilimnocola aggregata TaxID=2528021 RepID=A0A517YIF9_9BACT|nr:sigma factor-like helix-turn-helix DNA-binding protein [Anatilimnocola aggregata]QDU29994.1 Sigma-70, region 4 [Anatilimnocola aggregata]
MVAELHAPPSERDFQVFRLIKVEQRTTREVAEIVGISQTRVCQIVQRVLDFLVATAPADDDEKQRAQRLYVARELAAERFDFLFKAALDSFEESKGEETITRTVNSQFRAGLETSTTRSSCGDVRYLAQAARINVMAAKLAASRLPPWNLAVDESIADANEHDTSPAPRNHPLEDCSTEATESPRMAEKKSGQQAVSRGKRYLSRRELIEFFRGIEGRTVPVQEEAEGFSPREELEQVLATSAPLPDQQPAATGKPLTAKQRRARAKFLQRKRSAK